MIKYPFVADLITNLGMAGGTDAGAPSSEILREIAEALDYVILIPDALRDYCRHLHPLLRPLHRKYGLDPKAGRTKDVDMLPYLKPLSGELADDIVSNPLRNRQDEWLRHNRIDLLALNSPALEAIQERVIDELPDAWDALLCDESWTRRHDLRRREPVPGESETVQQAERELAGTRGGSSTSPDESVARIQLSASLDELGMIGLEHPENIGVMVATFDVEYGGKSMTVRSGGSAFVDQGCTLKLKWLQPDRKSLNGSALNEGPAHQEPCAEAVIRDSDEPALLVGEREYRLDQFLQFEFERSGHRPYKIAGVLKLKM